MSRASTRVPSLPVLILILGATFIAAPALADQTGDSPAAGGEESAGSGRALEEADESPPTRRVRGDRLAVGNRLVVPADVIHDGEIVCIMCDLTVDGEVQGSVAVVGGSVRVSGKVRRDLVAVLSNVELTDTARIGGELVNALGRMRDDGAEVRRGYVDVPLILPVSDAERPAAVLGALLLWLRSMAVVVFLVLVLVLAALVPRRVRAISDATPHRYLAGLLLGLAVYLGLPFLITLLVATVVGIPLVPFALIGFVVLTWLGRAAILHLIGERIGRMFGIEPSLLGAVLLGMVPYGLLLLVPLLADGLAGLIFHVVLSGAFFLLLDVPAIGLVLLTRAGEPRHPAVETVPAGPAEGPPPAPPDGTLPGGSA